MLNPVTNKIKSSISRNISILKSISKLKLKKKKSQIGNFQSKQKSISNTTVNMNLNGSSSFNSNTNMNNTKKPLSDLDVAKYSYNINMSPKRDNFIDSIKSKTGDNFVNRNSVVSSTVKGICFIYIVIKLMIIAVLIAICKC